MAKTVMVVDDDLDILSILTFAFESRGYRVRKAQDSQEALQVVSKFVPDVFLIDINLPGIDGLELCRRLRAQARTHNVPVVFLTGKDQPDVIVQGFQAGADDYVVKPFNMQELTARVENLLRRAQEGSPAKQRKEGSVIALTSARGGIGKTTLAVNLGVALARLWTEEVALVDASLEFGRSSVLLDLPQPRDLTALLQEQAVEIERDYLEETYMTIHSSGLRYLAGPLSPGDVESIGPAEVEQLLHLLKPAYGYIIVDLASSVREPYRSFLRLADQVVVVVNPEVLTLVATQSMLQTLAMLELPNEAIQLVLNDFPRAVNSPAQAEIESFLGLPLANTIPAEPLRIPAALNSGRPLVLDSSDGAFGQAVVRTAYYLSTSLAGH